MLGFTLVEALAAVVVMSAGLLGVLGAMQVAKTGELKARNQVLVRAAALTIIEECRAMSRSDLRNNNNLPNISVSRFMMPENATITLSISGYPNASETSIFKASVTITWKEMNGTGIITYETLIYKT